MKITKKQLRRIIREEKARLLNENNPTANAERALGLVANANDVEMVTNGVLDLLQGIEMGAVEEFDGDEEMAEEFARNGAILAVAQAFQSAGLMDVYVALTGLLR